MGQGLSLKFRAQLLFRSWVQSRLLNYMKGRRTAQSVSYPTYQRRLGSQER